MKALLGVVPNKGSTLLLSLEGLGDLAGRRWLLLDRFVTSLLGAFTQGTPQRILTSFSAGYGGPSEGLRGAAVQVRPAGRQRGSAARGWPRQAGGGAGHTSHPPGTQHSSSHRCRGPLWGRQSGAEFAELRFGNFVFQVTGLPETIQVSTSLERFEVCLLAGPNPSAAIPPHPRPSTCPSSPLPSRTPCTPCSPRRSSQVHNRADVQSPFACLVQRSKGGPAGALCLL